MPPERFPPDDPREWLNRARSSLSRAKVQTAEAYLEDLCFDAQQAAEKAIKAVLMKKGVAFPYIHDLARLLTLLEEAQEEIPEAVKQAEDLTRYAVITRYPGVTEPVTDLLYREAVSQAETVVRWAEQQIVSSSQTGPAGEKKPQD
jgi:HEPN domain-containing protein